MSHTIHADTFFAEMDVCIAVHQRLFVNTGHMVIDHACHKQDDKLHTLAVQASPAPAQQVLLQQHNTLLKNALASHRRQAQQLTQTLVKGRRRLDVVRLPGGCTTRTSGDFCAMQYQGKYQAIATHCCAANET
jgi:hypothetical protein